LVAKLKFFNIIFQLMDHAKELGEYLRKNLEELKTKHKVRA
jgi:4-aminobutyrate aminotransferase-like enzyme